MSRIRIKQTGQQPSKEPDPVWRGVGCVSMIMLTLGSYLVSGPLITFINGLGRLPFQIPNTLVPLINSAFNPPLRKFPFNCDACLPLPEGWVLLSSEALEFSSVRFLFSISPLQVVFAIFVAILGFAVMTMIWGIINPPKLGPQDAPPVRRKIDKSKVR